MNTQCAICRENILQNRKFCGKNNCYPTCHACKNLCVNTWHSFSFNCMDCKENYFCSVKCAKQLHDVSDAYNDWYACNDCYEKYYCKNKGD